jgi:hypothetical protein
MDTSLRPSPSQHASQTPIGTKMIGNDGNMWEVVADKNGTHRWVRADQKNYSGGRKYYKPSASSSFSKGDLLMTKNGWEFYRKTLTDGTSRVVYTISKLKETPQNKTDWEAIKGEMLTQTGFKWGRFGSFERWGLNPSEKITLNNAAEILGKYYSGKSDTNQPPQTPAPIPSGKKIFDANQIANDLLKMNANARDVADVSSGSELYADQTKQKIYIREMDKFISEYKDYDLANLSAPEWESVSDIITDANAHSLNNYLALRSYYGKDDYRAYVDLYNKYPNLQLNPANFVSEASSPLSGGATKEQLEKAIKGLKILADKGNAKAIAAMKGLNYLLSKK